ncbi:MAG: solute carrier family 23 protein [Reyranellales bacterium]
MAVSAAAAPRMRPAALDFCVDETPPLSSILMLGVQLAVVSVIYLVVVAIVVRAAKLPEGPATQVMSLACIAMGVGALLQTLRRGPIGSGFLAIPAYSTTHLAPSVVAAQLGGMPLVFGMTIVAGLTEMVAAIVIGLFGEPQWTQLSRAAWLILPRPAALGFAFDVGITSRVAVYPVAAILIAMGFVPKLALFFMLIPQEVTGSVLVFIACFTICGGMEIMLSGARPARQLRHRHLLAAGAERERLSKILRPAVAGPAQLHRQSAGLRHGGRYRIEPRLPLWHAPARRDDMVGVYGPGHRSCLPADDDEALDRAAKNRRPRGCRNR